MTLLKFVKFQRVSSLTLFVESNNGADYTGPLTCVCVNLCCVDLYRSRSIRPPMYVIETLYTHRA